MRNRFVIVSCAQARLLYLRRPFRYPRVLRGAVGSRQAKVLMRDRQARRQFLTSARHHSYTLPEVLED